MDSSPDEFVADSSLAHTDQSLGTDGSPKSADPAILTDSKTALRQEVIALRTENQWLRQQLAAQHEQIDELQAELKRYKNAHTPSSKKGGAGGDGSGHNDSDNDKTIRL